MTRQRPRTYTAGLANNIIFFVGALLIAGLLYSVLNEPALELLDAGAAHTSGEDAAAGQQWMREGWNALPFFILLLGLVQLIAAAAVEARTA